MPNWPRTALAVAALLSAAACATAGPPARFAAVPPASVQECEIIKAALMAVLQEQPYYAKPVTPPLISYIALTPALVADPFEEGPLSEVADMAPADLARCLGASLAGPDYRTMAFRYPEQLRNDRVVDSEGWVSRPVIDGQRATVLLWRGQCYRAASIEMTHATGVWTPLSITHSNPGATWAGRNPCAPWP